ncbi:MAG: 3-keto-5-aminohexanoate cleavage protein [Candidatus Latescibacteria bacterium]|jgi:3-keto-5-aminohexanoate cleavage enzyme|nr:3-keto-5-aminohexanoate cleavage protein [Candidatus Latescibacterota bacterium]
MDKLIITAAVSGSAPTKQQNPNVPYTPEEIANEALAAWRAGAAIAHIHVRDPETGVPVTRLDLFQEVTERIRSESDLIINLSTSGFHLDGPDADEVRLLPLEAKPDLCSLDVGSLNFRGGVFINRADWVERAAQRIRDAGVKPEIEVFDLGHIRQARHLIENGLVDGPPWLQLCLGISWGIEATVESLLAMRQRLPDNALWSVLAPAAAQLPITTHAMLMGGHVRVGFEDNLYLEQGVKADSNAQFVERTVSIARSLLREVASCEEAREILGLSPYPSRQTSR